MAVEEVKPEDKVVEDVVDSLVAPEVEEDVVPLLEPNAVPGKTKVHPLHPGGIRFEQVYAKGKQTERDLAATREQLAAANAKLEVLQGGKVTTTENEDDKEYSWSELETFITQGRITRADAEAHREAVREKKLVKTLSATLKKDQQTQTRSQVLQASISAYVNAVPAIMTEGSEDRIRLDEEFDFIASVQGVDTSKLDDATRQALQLQALRTVYGPVDGLEGRTVTPKTETHQGLPGGTRPAPKTNPDQELLNNLTKAQVKHYTKMMSAGRYPGGWKEVVEELKYEAPKKARR